MSFLPECSIKFHLLKYENKIPWIKTLMRQVVLMSIRNHKLLHVPEINTVNPTTSRVSFHDCVNLRFSVFFEVFLRLRKFCQPYGIVGEKTIIFLAGPIIFL